MFVQSGIRALLLAFAFTCLSIPIHAGDFSQDGVWQNSSDQRVSKTELRQWIPKHYRLLQLNSNILMNIALQAPIERFAQSNTTPVVLSLPVPDGTFENFVIEESSIMEPELAAKFPEIKTWKARGIDDRTASGRISWSSGGLRAIAITSRGTYFVEPSGDRYINFWMKDLQRPGFPFECPAHSGMQIEEVTGASAPLDTGATMRILQTAISATGEYTAIFGGTKNGAFNNGIVPAVNALNAIYEREFAVRLVLVADEMDVIYTDAASDPFTTPTNVLSMLPQNQATLDTEIGSANYDIGHVFGGLGGSGVAYLSVVCSSTHKGQGGSSWTNAGNPAFIVDLAAHEFGHQFSAGHSYNGTTGNCGPNRSASTAWEPASGTTIMSYSGSCGSENVQNFSDPYFHVGNYDQVTAHIGSRTCDTETATGNNAPTVNAGTDYTIPISTPFALTATGNDPDGDSITFLWEEWDLGTASPPNTDDGSRPIFRTFSPLSGPGRTFPKLSDILNGTTTLGESLPTTNRNLTFRVSVRDGIGGTTNDLTEITVTNSAGPFEITAPNTGVSWTGGTQQTVTWNVAGTGGSPVNASNVNILLSTDGGLTFTITLATNTPNDGSQQILAPTITTSSARIKVEASNNIFFDISNTNFSITSSGCSTISISPATLPSGLLGTPYNQTLTASGGTAPYVFAIDSGSLPSGLSLASGGALTGTPGSTGNYSFTVTATDDNSCIGVRSYTLNITSNTCLFCDDFNDGVISGSWTYVKPSWTESGGNLIGTPTGRKAIAIASPVFSGCSNCTVEGEMRTDGGPGNRVWMLGWHIDKRNTLELLMKEENDRWILKHKVGGRVAVKMKGEASIDPNVIYNARIAFDGTQFQVFIDGNLLFTMPKAAGTTPNGTVGFQSKATTCRINMIEVN